MYVIARTHACMHACKCNIVHEYALPNFSIDSAIQIDGANLFDACTYKIQCKRY